MFGVYSTRRPCIIESSFRGEDYDPGAKIPEGGATAGSSRFSRWGGNRQSLAHNSSYRDRIEVMLAKQQHSAST
jgi:hypothetical protein